MLMQFPDAEYSGSRFLSAACSYSFISYGFKLWRVFPEGKLQLGTRGMYHLLTMSVLWFVFQIFHKIAAI